MNGLSFVCASASPVVLGYFMGSFGGFAAALSLLIGIAVLGLACAVILTSKKF
jgi:hypothetical protein